MTAVGSTSVGCLRCSLVSCEGLRAAPGETAGTNAARCLQYATPVCVCEWRSAQTSRATCELRRIYGVVTLTITGAVHQQVVADKNQPIGCWLTHSTLAAGRHLSPESHTRVLCVRRTLQLRFADHAKKHQQRHQRCPPSTSLVMPPHGFSDLGVRNPMMDPICLRYTPAPGPPDSSMCVASASSTPRASVAATTMAGRCSSRRPKPRRHSTNARTSAGTNMNAP